MAGSNDLSKIYANHDGRDYKRLYNSKCVPNCKRMLQMSKGKRNAKKETHSKTIQTAGINDDPQTNRVHNLDTSGWVDGRRA